MQINAKGFHTGPLGIALLVFLKQFGDFSHVRLLPFGSYGSFLAIKLFVGIEYGRSICP